MKYIVRLLDGITEKTVNTESPPSVYQSFVFFGRDYLILASLVKEIELVEVS